MEVAFFSVLSPGVASKKAFRPHLFACLEYWYEWFHLIPTHHTNPAYEPNGGTKLARATSQMLVRLPTLMKQKNQNRDN